MDTLWMALARSYSLSAWTPDDLHVDRARALAPRLPRIEFMGLPATDVHPNYLGWLSYWSPEVAKTLGFPNPEKDAAILPLCKQFPSGAWIVKLTDEPLDLEREDHVDALVWAYWRFDKVGKRLQPVDKKRKAPAKKPAIAQPTSATLKRFVLRERDEEGRWWEAASAPIQAATAEDALRAHFAKMAHGRPPRSKESLEKLRNDYAQIAFEVGLTRPDDMEVVEASD